MTEPRLSFVQCLDSRGLHRMAYWEWGDPANPRVLVCLHGLTRQGRDFDTLARALCDTYRVVCPDVVGRGRSDRLADPAGYQIPSYLADMVTLLARLNASRLDWVGTSMGGLVGMLLGAQPGSPIGRMVLNDVGPKIEFEALQRIGTYLGVAQRWSTVDEAADYLRSISTGFGPHTREQWLALTLPMLVREADACGGATYRSHYDLDIALPFRSITPQSAAAGEAALWRAYDAIACPTLLLRGAESDLLTTETARAMTARGPKARLREFAGIGHAPTLVAPEQIDVVREFLLAG
ncbi:MAG: alpha/beta hydrolase [Burkholderiaceae bacterium]